LTGQQQDISQGSSARSKSPEVRQPAPSVHALEVAGHAAKRVDKRATTVRYGFVRLAPDGEAAGPMAPLAGLIRGSKGGALRIRLYLALLWMAGGGDGRHSVTFPARAFAELLDLPDPSGRGERRVREALKLFQKQKLLRVEAQPGRPSTLYLLQEDACGTPYTRPGAHTTAAKDRGEVNPTHLFIQLPASFWTEGWVLVLSAPALAMLLVLLVLTANGRKPKQWVSPSQRRQYGLSDDTWTRGIAELKAHGLVEVGKAPVSRDFEWKRVRNTYTLHAERLGESPSERQAVKPPARPAGSPSRSS
jgi:hypothetical protein